MLAFVAFVAGTASAQVDEFPCGGDGDLWASIQENTLGLGYEQGKDLVFSKASSVLAAAASREPKRTPTTDEAVFVTEHGAWSCTYGAPNLFDGDERTAWAEGDKGPGIGAVVVVPLPTPAPVEIRGGYGKSPELYKQNARPRRVEVLVLGQGLPVPFAQYDAKRAIPVLGRAEVELKDVDGWQPLALPKWGPPPASWQPGGPPGTVVDPAAQRPTYLALRILSVYPGEQFEDTCISEVRAAR